MPAFYQFLDRFLPWGATVDTIRSAIYLRRAQPVEPILVAAGNRDLARPEGGDPLPSPPLERVQT